MKTTLRTLLLTLLAPTILLAQESSDYQASASSTAGGLVGGLIGLIVAVIMIAAMWKIFTKAGEPGWAAIIPIVNIYFLCKVAGRPGWWVILMFIPLVNFIIWIILCIDVAKNFGKGAGFGIGLAFLGVIFFPILGFGSATYQGPSAGA
ncbi:MAG: hypothetical protein QOG67_1762 [Verrucomicrobiota bacterium]|jgi:hypothetical protein